MEAEERKRQEAVERLGEERGEGQWVFSFVEDGVNGGDEGDGGKGGMKVQGVGWGDIDGGDGGGAGATGRRSWGRFNRVVEVCDFHVLDWVLRLGGFMQGLS